MNLSQQKNNDKQAGSLVGPGCATPAPRLLWIDFLRGLAVLGMIEAHSVNSFLDPSYRSGPWFAALSYLNGWVAPTFLFVAGYLQGSALRRNWETPKPVGPRLRSLGLILLIGYALQFPWDALNRLYPLHAGGWEMILHSLARIDILHCLAVSLTFLFLTARLFKKQAHYDLALLLLTSLLVALAPFIWAAFPSIIPPIFPLSAPLLSYGSPSYGALFPVVPWFAFVAAGTLASTFVSSTFNFHLSAFLLTALAGWLCKWTLTPWQLAHFPEQNYAVRYDAFFFRLSLVLLTSTVCAWLFRNPQSSIRISPINWSGSRSLSLYVWHLILLHSGLGLLPPLRTLFPRTQTPFLTFWLYLLTLAASILLAWLWEKVKNRKWRTKS